MVPIEWERREYRVASAVSMAHDFAGSVARLVAVAAAIIGRAPTVVVGNGLEGGVREWRES